jgi:hypothetical protein
LRFTSFLSHIGFRGSKADTSLFVYRQDSSSICLLLYADDIILMASSTSLLCHFINQLQSEFAMSDLGPLQHFLGISVHHTHQGLFLSQEQYATDLITRANMLHCNSCLTPAAMNAKLSITDGKPLHSPMKYRSLVGALQYLTLTRPGISFAIQQAWLYMHSPTNLHFNLVKRILRYMKGTLHHGLNITRSASSDLIIYSDAD